MGTAETQGKLWSKKPQDWATIQEPMHRPIVVFMDCDLTANH